MTSKRSLGIAGCVYAVAVSGAVVVRLTIGDRAGTTMAFVLLVAIAAAAVAAGLLALDGAGRRWWSLTGTFGVTCAAALPVLATDLASQQALVGQLWRRDEPARHLVTLIVLLVTWELLLLWTRELRARAERRMTRELTNRIGSDDERELSWDEVLVASEDQRATLTHARVKLIAAQKAHPAAASEAAIARADRDEAALQSEYGPLRAIVWALPALGFIGTAASMSASIGGIGSAVAADADGSGQQQALVDVIPSLGNAFNITLIALSSTVVCYLLMAIVGAREERSLLAVQDVAMRAVGRIERAWPPTPGVDEMGRLITELWSLEKEIARLRGPIAAFAGGDGSASTISQLLYASTVQMKTLNENSAAQAEAMQALAKALRQPRFAPRWLGTPPAASAPP